MDSPFSIRLPEFFLSNYQILADLPFINPEGAGKAEKSAIFPQGRP